MGVVTWITNTYLFGHFQPGGGSVARMVGWPLITWADVTWPGAFTNVWINMMLV